MKIQKSFEASTENTPMNEIKDFVINYELSRLLENIVENEPTRIVKINWNVSIEY